MVIGLVMILISAVFWCLEAAEFIKAVKCLQVPDAKNPFVRVGLFVAYVLGFVSALPKLWKLGVDVLVTIVLSLWNGRIIRQHPWPDNQQCHISVPVIRR